MSQKKICYITTISVTLKSFFTEQMNYLAKNGFDVYAICSPDEYIEKSLGNKIKYLPVEITRGISPVNNLKSIFKLIKIFKKENFSIIQYSTPNAAFVSSIAATLSGAKIKNYHLMGLRYEGFKGITRSIFKLIEKITCLFSTEIECVSESVRKTGISDKIFKINKTAVIWNGSTGGVDLKRFDSTKRSEWRTEIRNLYSIAEDEFVFGFVGRITKDKGINELLEAYLTTDFHSRLFIIGNVEGYDTLDKELFEKAHKDERIIFIGTVSCIEKYYSAMDVLVLPSYREGFGMVIAEAAAMGTPAIISDIPGPVDVVIPNKTALIVKVKNVDDLREKMLYAYNNREIISDMLSECVNHISDKFNSTKLCEKILERKEFLLIKNKIR